VFSCRIARWTAIRGQLEIAGDTILSVAFPRCIDDLADFELVEEGNPYREWCVPAAHINGVAHVAFYERDDSWIAPPEEGS
jgi:hypothetical protein